ncbi:hypothetical protein [Phenylobacterium sp.]|uniref:hypothetical protein n=1 Tax=Phenylobacterium sp. TaxID=1871053 RepID=UPI0035B08AA9
MQQPTSLPLPLPRLRLAGRVGAAFFLDLVALGRGPLDLLDSLILIAIVQANVSTLTRDPDVAVTYADYDAVPPDDLRRRVSVSAIAHSLRLPYETVRRRVARLAGFGALVTTPTGVYVPGVLLHSPAHRDNTLASYAAVRDFYYRMRDLGVATGLPRPDRAAAAAPPVPVRAVVRIVSDFALRTVDLLTAHVGDLVRGLIFLTVLRCNTEHLPDEESGTDDDGAAGFVSDGLRRPVRFVTISERLGLPEETVRRHANKLVKDGLCVRQAEGLVAPAAVLARPAFQQFMTDNQMNIRRMFEAMARLGVVAEWDRMAAESA